MPENKVFLSYNNSHKDKAVDIPVLKISTDNYDFNIWCSCDSSNKARFYIRFESSSESKILNDDIKKINDQLFSLEKDVNLKEGYNLKFEVSGDHKINCEIVNKKGDSKKIDFDFNSKKLDKDVNKVLKSEKISKISFVEDDAELFNRLNEKQFKTITTVGHESSGIDGAKIGKKIGLGVGFLIAIAVLVAVIVFLLKRLKNVKSTVNKKNRGSRNTKESNHNNYCNCGYQESTKNNKKYYKYGIKSGEDLGKILFSECDKYKNPKEVLFNYCGETEIRISQGKKNKVIVETNIKPKDMPQKIEPKLIGYTSYNEPIVLSGKKKTIFFQFSFENFSTLDRKEDCLNEICDDISYLLRDYSNASNLNNKIKDIKNNLYNKEKNGLAVKLIDCFIKLNENLNSAPEIQNNCLSECLEILSNGDEKSENHIEKTTSEIKENTLNRKNNSYIDDISEGIYSPSSSKPNFHIGDNNKFDLGNDKVQSSAKDLENYSNDSMQTLEESFENHESNNTQNFTENFGNNVSDNKQGFTNYFGNGASNNMPKKDTAINIASNSSKCVSKYLEFYENSNEISNMNYVSIKQVVAVKDGITLVKEYSTQIEYAPFMVLENKDLLVSNVINLRKNKDKINECFDIENINELKSNKLSIDYIQPAKVDVCGSEEYKLVEKGKLRLK